MFIIYAGVQVASAFDKQNIKKNRLPLTTRLLLCAQAATSRVCT